MREHGEDVFVHIRSGPVEPPFPLTPPDTDGDGVADSIDTGNGTFDDGAGTRWSVYDRRASDERRRVIDRDFVSSNGEVRRCENAPSRRVEQ